jgi:hypothetical protein
MNGYEECEHYRVLVVDIGLMSFWNAVMMPKHSPLYNTVNFAVTNRMARLEFKSPSNTELNKCMQHFFPTNNQRDISIGFKPLSLPILSGLFVILIVLLLFACVVFVLEVCWTRHTHGSVTSVPTHLEMDSLDDTHNVYNSCVSDIQQACRQFNLNQFIIKDGVITFSTF